MTKHLRAPALVLLLALLALTVVACSKGPADAGPGDTTDGGAGEVHSQGVRFAECMRANGISDFPDPDASGDFDFGMDVSGEVWTSTLAACEHLQPEGSFSADRSTEQQSAALEFAQCIRDNGVEDFPDPVNGDPLVDTTKIPSSDTPDGMAILNAAMATCGDLAEAAIVQP